MSDKLWWRCKLAAVQTVKNLDITGSTAADTIGANVFSRIGFDWPIFPCVLANTERQVPRRIGGTSKTKLIELPVVLWIGDAASPNQHEREEMYHDWFQIIYDAFDQQRLAGVSEVNSNTMIDTTPFLDRSLPQYQRIVMGMCLKFQATKQR